MFRSILNFYKVSKARPCSFASPEEQRRKMTYYKWSTFLSATLGYGMYYVCRLSLNVVKKPIVEEGVFSETELGIIGSVHTPLVNSQMVSLPTEAILTGLCQRDFLSLHWSIFVWDL